MGVAVTETALPPSRQKGDMSLFPEPEREGCPGTRPDEAAGSQCKAYGAAGIMRLPTRLRVTWHDDNTLKIETDAGSQTRLLRFGAPLGEAGSWQGVSVASWEYPRAPVAARGFGPGPAAGPPPGGTMKVVTTQMRRAIFGERCA
jgi:hypothetical protein